MIATRQCHHNETTTPRGLIQCGHCGAMGFTDDAFCACCGGRMENHCPKCGAFLRHRIANYCPKCGEHLQSNVADDAELL